MAWYLELTYSFDDIDFIFKTDKLIEKTLGQERDSSGTLFTDNTRSLSFVFDTREDAEAAAEKVKQLFKEHNIQGDIYAIYQYEGEDEDEDED